MMRTAVSRLALALCGALLGCGEQPAAENVTGVHSGLSLASYPGTPANFSKTLSSSLFGNVGDGNDLDHDGLVDDLENSLADQFRPYIFFDSHESARTPSEPYTFFQVRPVDSANHTKVVRIRYISAFEYDGGYGPASWCSDAHPGDLEDITFRVVSTDGVTWTLDSLQTWGPVSWSRHQDQTLVISGNDLEPGHPIIFMSASKHHQHLTTADDDHDSPYSDWGCNDNVNGSGAKVLVDLKSVGSYSSPYNNLGEPESHPVTKFVGRIANVFEICTARYLDPTTHSIVVLSGLPPSVAERYADHTCEPYPYEAWGGAGFYSVDPLGGKAMRNLMVGPVDYSLTDFTFKDFPPMWCMDGMLVSGFECAGSYCGSVALRCATTHDQVTSHVWTPYFSEESPSQQICNGGFVNAVECRGDNCDDLSFQCVTLAGVSPQNCHWTETISEEHGPLDFGGNAAGGFYLAGARCSGDYCDNLTFYVCQRSGSTPEPQAPSLPTSTTLPTSEEYPPVYCGDDQLVSGVFCRGSYCDNVGFQCTDVPGAALQNASWTDYFSEESPSSKTCPNGFAVGIRCHHDSCDNISLLCAEMGNGAPQDCYWTSSTLSEEGRDAAFPSGYYLAGVQCFGDYCDNKKFYLCRYSGSEPGGEVIPLPSDVPITVTLTANQEQDFYADNWPSRGIPFWTANVVLSVNSLGGKPIPAGTVTVNGRSYAIGANGAYYQVIDIPDAGPYTISISITDSDILQLQLGNR